MALSDWQDRAKRVSDQASKLAHQASKKGRDLVGGNHDDEPDMYKSNDMQYRVKDNTYQDVYRRGSRNKSHTDLLVKLLPRVVVGVLQLFIVILIPMLLVAVAPSGRLNIFSAFFFLYIMPISGTFRGLCALGLTYGAYKGTTVFTEKYSYSQNILNSQDMLDQYPDDARLQQPEELSENYDIFPDGGMHSKGTDVTAILGHLMLTNDGLNPINMVVRADGQNDIDDDGSVINKNVPLYDDNDQLLRERTPMIDTEFGERLWDSDLVPRPSGKNAKYIQDVLRKRYAANRLLYNPTHRFGKPDFKTVADRINDDWYMPDYEVQRPAGLYIVDTEPNNTMVLAMTRAGKGQSYIEPTIDAWLRSDVKSNIICNDPKGELYLKFYYLARKRKFKVVSFNLMEPSRTDIYNPLGYAIEAARQNDNQKVEEYVKTIGDVFFPPDKSDDPMWPNAANAAFQRSALGLIDYYMEEDRDIHDKAQSGNWSMMQLNRALDESWGHVTLYNVYQMMTKLASKKSKDAAFIHLDSDDQSDEKDYLTLFFDATAKLPTNALRTSVQNQDNSLRAMAGSDKTIASVYGISLTAIKFFADDRISRLTSGRPSQNFDIVGLSFPRRFDVKIDTKYTKDEGLRGQSYRWTVYKDQAYSQYLGKDFDYKNNIDPSGWINYVTKGIFPQETVYLKLEVSEQTTNLAIHTWYFRFTKDYQRSLDGRTYVIDPVSGQRVVKDGYLVEVQPTNVVQHTADGVKVGSYVKAVVHNSVLPRHRVSLLESAGSNVAETGKIETYDAYLFEQVQIHYSEEVSFVDFITPPHLKSYSKIILILVNQLFNMQVDKSYLTFASQKPLYKTKYMLDEIGNLSSDGSGIPDLQTKESIGLQQGQYFTLILQTLQQLKDIYGESIDQILQGNTGNIVYLKSTDDSMLETLEGLGGKMHRIEQDTQTVTKNMSSIVNKMDGKVSLNRTPKEVPTISKNDMLHVYRGNAMVFGKGNPIWDRNQTDLPFAFMSVQDNALQDFENPQEYTLRTVPTTANTMDFDVLNNQPNFIQMVSRRVTQARLADAKLALYKQNHLIHGHSLTDDDLAKIDPEFLSKELMREIRAQINFNNQANHDSAKESDAYSPDDFKTSSEIANGMPETEEDKLTKGLEQTAETNDEVLTAQKEQDEKANAVARTKFANNKLSVHDLLYDVTDDTRNLLSAAYASLIDEFKASDEFDVDDQNNLLMNKIVMIKSNAGALDSADDDFGGGSSALAGLASDDDKLDAGTNYTVQQEWLKYLAGLPNWQSILHGDYDKAVSELFDIE